MASLDLNHIISPYSLVVEYRTAPDGGFYLFPHNDVEPGGWGKPYTLPDGTPVPDPGTPVSAGGTDPNRRVVRDKDTLDWDVKRKPGDWLYGNIDWRGELIDVDKDPDLTRKLSYHGPSTRYFAVPSFVYGSISEHNEIYEEGKYCDVAPQPVLGAAITVFVDPITTLDVEYIVAMCKEGVFDVLYIRKKVPLIPPKSMTSALRSELMERHDPVKHPNGWLEILRVGRQVSDNELAQDARTPWFFSQNGRQCQCMREMQKTHNNGQDSVTEPGLNRYKVFLSNPTTATFLNQRNTSGYEYECTTDKDTDAHGEATQPDFNQAGYPYDDDCPRNPGSFPRDVRHFFSIDKMNQLLTMDGSYYVAVDYHENSEIVVSMRYEMWRSFTKWWRYCIDDEVAANVLSTTYNNTNFQDASAEDDRWTALSWFDSGGDYIRSLNCAICQDASCGDSATYFANGGTIPPLGPHDGEGRLWLGVSDNMNLSWTHPETNDKHDVLVYSVEDGTTAKYKVPASNDLNLSARYIYRMFPLYLDVRAPEGAVYAARTELTTKRLSAIDSFTNESINQEYVRYEYSDPFTAGAKVASEEKGKEYTVSDTVEPMTRSDMVALDPTGATNSPFEPTTGSWTRKEFYWEYFANTVSGTFFTPTDYTSKGLEPHPDDWLEDAWGDVPWPTWVEVLSSTKNETEGGYGHQDNRTVCMSFKYTKGLNINGTVADRPITQPGAVRVPYYFNYLTGEDLDNLIPPADRFYPIGVE